MSSFHTAGGAGLRGSDAAELLGVNEFTSLWTYSVGLENELTFLACHAGSYGVVVQVDPFSTYT